MVKLDINVILLILSFVLKAKSIDDDEENYCDPNLCDDGVSHIACDHYLEFAQNCGEEPELVELTPREKKSIIRLHNHHRNIVAAGKLPGYAPAVRMPIIKWNEDLAYMASLQVRSCSTDNDNCRNTIKFKNSGQNIGFDIVDDSIHNITSIIKSIIDHWVESESKLGNQHNIKSIKEEDLVNMRRFYLMVNDKVSDVGCAMIKFIRDDSLNVIFTCNYGSNNHVSRHVYEAGPACSKCLSGCHRFYKALCRAEEKVNPNVVYNGSFQLRSD